MNYKFVFDTNALISAALLRNSINAQALDYALKYWQNSYIRTCFTGV